MRETAARLFRVLARPPAVKICGVTTVADAVFAADAGAALVGVNLWPGSKRYCPAEQARAVCASLRGRALSVAVLVNPSAGELRSAVEDVGVDVVQLHGEEPVALYAGLGIPVIKAFRVDGAAVLERANACPADLVLLDSAAAQGGSGVGFDWSLAGRLTRPYLLAGGLTPETVGAAVRRLQPAGVDVASGVEQAPGVKDSQKVARFIRAAKEAVS